MNGGQLFAQHPENENSRLVFGLHNPLPKHCPGIYSENRKLTERLGEMVFQL